MKEIVFVGSTRSDLAEAPVEIKRTMGGALRRAQEDRLSADASPMKGTLREVIEISDQDESGTYRAMYTVAIGDVVYVLDFFKKKSTSGIATPQVDLERVLRRLKKVREQHDATTR